MEKERIFRARQNVTHTDLNALQDYTQQTFDDLIRDVLISGRGFSGFAVTKASTINASVAAGRLYDTGKIFTNDAAVTVSMTPYLPSAAKKIVTIVTYAQTVETDVQPRDFLINVTTRATEPQSVAMIRARVAQVSPIGGVEAADPKAPAVPSGYVAIADVLLGTGGIETITMRDANRIPELDLTQADIDAINVWQKVTGKTIDGIRTDLAKLANAVKGLGSVKAIQALEQDMAVLKERFDIPDTASYYGADNFLDKGETDATNVDLLCDVDEGIRFSAEAQSSRAIELDNPFNGLVKLTANGMIIPNYTVEAALTVGAPVANETVTSIPISDKQFQNFTFKKKAMSRSRIRFGSWFWACPNMQFYRTGNYDPITNVFTSQEGETFLVDPANYKQLLGSVRQTRLQRFWTDEYEDPYWDFQTTTINKSGHHIAQSWLNQSPRVCVGISLMFTQLAAAGDVNVAICEVEENGTPNLDALIAETTVTRANLKAYPEWTDFPFEPTILEVGKQYAMVLTTNGAHHLATSTDAKAYSYGNLMDSTDGVYFVGDITKDLRFKVNTCLFDRTSLTVDLKPLELSGGVTDIDVLVPMLSTKPANVMFQTRINGVWKNIYYAGDTFFSSLPSLIPLRAVLTGTNRFMPILHTPTSRILVKRPRKTLKHISSVRTLPTGATTTSITVRLEVGQWIAARHTLAVKILSGATYSTVTTAAQTRIVAMRGRPDYDKGYEMEFVFNFGSAISSYKIQIEGTTDNYIYPFHIERRTDTAA